MRKIRLRIQEFAEQKNISIEELAARADLHPDGIYHLYRCPYVTSMTINVLARLGEALNVPTGDLLEDLLEDIRDGRYNSKD